MKPCACREIEVVYFHFCKTISPRNMKQTIKPSKLRMHTVLAPLTHIPPCAGVKFALAFLF
jgi:hypothetical protein